MKVYALPKEVPAPEIDWSKPDDWRAKEAAHAEALKAWLIRGGYTGPRTGEIARFPHADGYANYMLADGAKKSVLIHLPYGDAWNYPYIERLTKKDILENLDRAKALNALFAKKKATA